jgi:hypothetical protein
MENTNPSGSENLTVNQAAATLLGMMEPDEPTEEVQAQAEPEEQEEVQAESESESESVEDDDVEEAPEQPKRKYKVKAAGEEIEVDEDELIKGYQRSKDYTKKSQEVAEQRKAIEAERAKLSQVAQERQAYAQRLQAIDQILVKQMQGENLESLKETDPIGYAVKVAERTEKEKQLSVIRAEQQRIAQVQQAEQQQKLQAHLQSEAQKLVDVIPEFGTEKGQELKREIRDYALNLGYSEQDLANLYDHRAVLALYKAMKFEKLQQAKPDAMKRVQEAPKVLKAGTSTPPTKSDADKKAMQRLRDSGKVRDAANVFERFL